MSRKQSVGSGRRRACAGVRAAVTVGALLSFAALGGGQRAATAAPKPATAVASVASVAVPASWSAVVPDESGANAEGPAPSLPGQYVNRTAMEARLVELTNQARVAKGLRPLKVDPRLTRLTRWWAANANQPAFSGRGTNHCPSNMCAVRAAEIGYPSFGEVIRAWNPFPAGDMADERFFVDSPRHMAILTNPKVTHIGFGVHITGDAGAPQSVVVVGQVGRAR